MIKGFLTLYIAGLISGLLFPFINALMCQHVRGYREADHSYFISAYREVPMHYKLLAALLPVVNLIWVFELS